MSSEAFGQYDLFPNQILVEPLLRKQPIKVNSGREATCQAGELVKGHIAFFSFSIRAFMGCFRAIPL